MTRLDASSEPSMEDILASIRKIIAEEPPGSRPLPPLTRAEPASASPFGRSFMQREPQFQAPLATPELTMRALGAASNDVAYPSLSTPEPRLMQVSRNDEFQSESHSEARNEARTEAKVRSVEDQLSDLLDDEPAPASVAADQRAGFSVSLDGYVPGRGQDGTNGDPFEFDLGPSPFEIKANPSDVAALSRDARPSAAELVTSAVASSPALTDLGSIVPSRHGFDPYAADVPVEAAAKTVAPEPALDVAPAVMQQPAAKSAPVEAVAPAAEIAREVKFVTPRVDATLSPLPYTPAGRDESRHAAAVETVAAAAPVNANASRLPETAIAVFEPLLITSETDNAASSQVPAVAASTSGQQLRTLEDTVADLLRPMLKNWLAENMPKIVERALRREMSEQNLSEHKTAAE